MPYRDPTDGLPALARHDAETVGWQFPYDDPAPLTLPSVSMTACIAMAYWIIFHALEIKDVKFLCSVLGAFDCRASAGFSGEQTSRYILVLCPQLRELLLDRFGMLLSRLPMAQSLEEKMRNILHTALEGG